MNDREGGYALFHRQIQSWSLWPALKAEHRAVWMLMVLNANWKDSTAWHGTQRIEVKRGQLLASEETIARMANTTRKIVRNTLAKLTLEGSISRETGPNSGQHPSLITIVNYEKFQTPFAEEGQQQGQGGARVGPGLGQGRAPSERRGKKGKEETEGRFAPLMARLVDVYAEVRGIKYAVVPADPPAVKRLMGYGSDGEIEGRWRKALALGSKWPGTSTIAGLASRWNELAVDASPFSATAQPVDPGRMARLPTWWERAGQARMDEFYRRRGEVAPWLDPSAPPNVTGRPGEGPGSWVVDGQLLRLVETTRGEVEG